MGASSTSFKPGQSGNPNGRPPRDWSWKELLEQAAEEEIEMKNKLGAVTGKMKLKEVVTKKLWSMAAKGDIQAVKEIFDRMDGKPEQSVAVDGTMEIIFHDSLKQEETDS